METAIDFVLGSGMRPILSADLCASTLHFRLQPYIAVAFTANQNR